MQARVTTIIEQTRPYAHACTSVNITFLDFVQKESSFSHYRLRIRMPGMVQVPTKQTRVSLEAANFNTFRFSVQAGPEKQ
jgi:hypothetical protein